MYKIPQEVLDYSKKFRLFDKSKIIIDQSDGLWIYNGDIDFSNNKDFVEFPEWFRNFKEIRGSLYCYRCSITDFTGLNNLTKIGRGLYCSGTSITDFTGLENLRSIGGVLDCSRTPLKSFKGLENLTKIGGGLFCSETSITSFNGLEQCELNPDIIHSVEIQEIYKEWKKSKHIKDIINVLECV